MSYPTKYTRQYDYVSYQNANPNRPLPANQIHSDLNQVALTTSEIVEFLKKSVRSDGAIANESVSWDQLSLDVKASIGENDAVATITTMAEQASIDAATASTAATTAQSYKDTTVTLAANAAGSASSAATSASAAAASATVVVGDQFTFDNSVSMAAPAAGGLRFNNTTVASVTALAFAATSAASGNPDISDYIATWGASTNTAKGTITVRKLGTPATFAVFRVTAAVTDNTSWLQATVTYVSGAGTFSAGDSLSVQFARAGDKGADGVGVTTFNGATGAVATSVVEQVFTASGTYTPTPGMKYAIIRCLGGGGAGGGVAGVGSNAASAGGGGAGSYSEIIVTAATIGASKAVTIGAGGTAGTAGANAGNNGGDTSVGTICVAKGGSGGGGATAGSAAGSAGAGGIVGTGTIAATGASGGAGYNATIVTVLFPSAAGASSPYGGGGAGRITSGAGNAATGFGAGGGAALEVNNAANAAGGAGSPGLVHIIEFVQS